MKHLKTFENIKKHIPKFEIYELVKIIGDKNNIIYIIDGYDYNKVTNIKNVCRLKKYTDKDKLASREGFYVWIQETNLVKAEKYEIDAQKYNL